MKRIILSIFIITSAYANNLVPTAADMKFITEFTTFACKSFRDKADAPNEIAKLDVSFTKLGISDSTRRIILDVESNDGQCFYSADFSRQKGFKKLDFETSYMTNKPECMELKEQLDRYISPGFKYIIKYNAYISMLFLTKELTSVCDDISGNKLIEFEWKI